MSASSTSHRDEPIERPTGAGADRPVYVLDRDAIRTVDRTAMEDYGIPGIVLMENASRGLMQAALEMLEEAGDPPKVVVICGSGNNGGDGWALARHLHNAGVNIVVAPLKDPRPESDAGVNCAICRKMKITEIPIEKLGEHGDANLMVDGIFGTGLDREVRGKAAEIIRWINDAGRPVLAIDLPSGLDCNTGEALGVAVKAARTVTFVGLKPGLVELHAQPYVGEATVVDIGAPAELARRLGKPLSHPPVDDRRTVPQDAAEPRR